MFCTASSLQATVNCSCLCSLHFVMLITNAQPCQNSVQNLCGMQSSQMPLPGSWISAPYFKNKQKALNTLLNSAEYTITRERVFLLPCLQSQIRIMEAARALGIGSAGLLGATVLSAYSAGGLRPNSQTKSSLKSFPPCYSQSPLQLCLEISIS